MGGSVDLGMRRTSALCQSDIVTNTPGRHKTKLQTLFVTSKLRQHFSGDHHDYVKQLQSGPFAYGHFERKADDFFTVARGFRLT
ncbi:hypothetical protein J6590_043229 [Homalodisca vitripennis]|nr:hypothetical protein J6590_043229 [Homalodisca vitripennis]